MREDAATRESRPEMNQHLGLLGLGSLHRFLALVYALAHRLDCERGTGVVHDAPSHTSLLAGVDGEDSSHFASGFTAARVLRRCFWFAPLQSRPSPISTRSHPSSRQTW